MLVGWNQADVKALKMIAVFSTVGLASQNQESHTCKIPRPLDIHYPLNLTFCFFPLTVLVKLNVQPQSVEMDRCCMYGNMLLEKNHTRKGSLRCCLQLPAVIFSLKHQRDLPNAVPALHGLRQALNWIVLHSPVYFPCSLPSHFFGIHFYQ